MDPRIHELEATVDGSSSPAVVDLVALRELCAEGPLPESPPFLRARIWQLLLGSLPPEKSLWPKVLQDSRLRYSTIARRFLEDVKSAPKPTASLTPNDRLLDMIHKDVVRIRLHTRIEFSPSLQPSSSSPHISRSEPSVALSANILQQRIACLRQGAPSPLDITSTPEIQVTAADTPPPSPSHGSLSTEGLNKSPTVYDSMSAFLRILYFHSLLHPDRPYNQSFPSLLVPIYTVIAGQASETDDPYQAEADVFWAFGELIGDVGLVIGAVGDDDSEDGVRGLLRLFSARLRWADEELWEHLKTKSLDPTLPYWSFRWISCMIAQSLPLSEVIPIWDLLLAQPPSTLTQRPRLSFLIDVCTSMVLRLRSRLVVAGNTYKGGLWGEEAIEEERLSPDGTMGDGFVEGMKILQNYPIRVIGVISIIHGAWWLVDKERREGLSERVRSAPNGAAALARVGIQLRGLSWGTNAASRTRIDTDDETDGHSDSTARPSRFTIPRLFDSADAAATLSKARSNWTAAAIDAWSRPRSGSIPSPSSSFQVIADKTKGMSLKRWAWGSRSDANTESAPGEPTTLSERTSFSDASHNRIPSQEPQEKENVTLKEARSHQSHVNIPDRSVVAQPSSPPLSPAAVGSRGPRPLILSNRRVTRDYSASRQSSISSMSTRGDSRMYESDTPPSRVVPLRRRQRVDITGTSSSPGSPLDSFIPQTHSSIHQAIMSPSPTPRTPSLPNSPSTLSNSPSPPTPANRTPWHHSFSTRIEGPEDVNSLPLLSDLTDGSKTVHSTDSNHTSHLRVKRSLPPIQSLASSSPLSDSISDTSEDDSSRSPLTPKPFPGRHSPDPLTRRRSPRGKRSRKTSRGHVPGVAPETPLMISEEEGMKGDDEDDYDDLINAYSTDDVDSN